MIKFPLIHLDDRKDWARWLDAAGVEAPSFARPRAQSRQHGHRRRDRRPGRRAGAHDAGRLRSDRGRLLRPFAEDLRLSKTYWIICPKATTNLPKIVTFRDWLIAEAASDMRQLKKLGAGVSRAKS